MEIEEYQTRTEALIIQDAPNEPSDYLDFHVKTGDYFAVIATVLGFIEETVRDCSCGMSAELVPLEVKTIQNLRRDLSHLHDAYQIVPK